MPACICRVPFCRPPAPTGAVSLPACLPACLKRIPRAPAIVKSPVSQLLFHCITSRAPPQGRPRPFSPFFRRARRKNGDRETGAGERRAQTGPGGECRGAGTGLPASPPGGNAGNERKPPGVLARAVARRWGWHVPLPPDRKRRARRRAGSAGNGRKTPGGKRRPRLFDHGTASFPAGSRLPDKTGAASSPEKPEITL